MMRRFLILTVLLLAVAPISAYTIDLTLYNTEALLENDGLTPLAGNASSGDLVQLVLAGQNGVVDTPDTSGNPSGDDVLLYTTYVGKGLPFTDVGLLVQTSILYDSALIGTNAYVRFWDAPVGSTAFYYGVSDMFTLPDGDVFHLAEFDFVPNAGAAHIANVSFEANLSQTVPEPSNFFLFGLMFIGLFTGWQRQWTRRLAVLVVLGLGLVTAGHAQDLRRFEVTASSPIVNTNGTTLVGSNPDVAGGIAGCLVQVIDVGANGVPDQPASDGAPGGDDTNVWSTVIGKGIAPNVPLSGRFSASFYPPLAVGTRLYARVFNAPTKEAATHWGQSATFVTDNTTVMDVSRLGLTATWMPKGVDLNTVGPKGLTYQQELIAGTNPLDVTDRFEATMLPGASPTALSLSVAGRAGRRYALERTTDSLGSGASWTEVLVNGPLTTDANLVFSDPNPPQTSKAFYRVKVTMP